MCCAHEKFIYVQLVTIIVARLCVFNYIESFIVTIDDVLCNELNGSTLNCVPVKQNKTSK